MKLSRRKRVIDRKLTGVEQMPDLEAQQLLQIEEGGRFGVAFHVIRQPATVFIWALMTERWRSASAGNLVRLVSPRLHREHGPLVRFREGGHAPSLGLACRSRRRSSALFCWSSASLSL